MNNIPFSTWQEDSNVTCMVVLISNATHFNGGTMINNERDCWNRLVTANRIGIANS